MEAIQIIQEIQRLSLDKKFHIVQETIKEIREEEACAQTDLAVKLLYNDYVNDIELTSFTSLDFQDFYETK